MKKIILNIIGYIIYAIIVAGFMWLVIEGLDDTPTGRYHKALDDGMSWAEYVEKN